MKADRTRSLPVDLSPRFSDLIQMEAAHSLTKMGGYNVSLWLHTENDAPKDMWDAAIQEIAVCSTKNLRSIVVSDGYAPNAARRAQLSNEAFRGARVKSAVVTTVLSNPIKRGIATALTWLNPHFAFFHPDQFKDALAHVDLAAEIADVWAALGKLQAQLPPVHNLELIAKACALPPLPGLER